jgi:hypothetical protein
VRLLRKDSAFEVEIARLTRTSVLEYGSLARKWPAPAGIHPAGAVIGFGKRTCKPNSVVCGHSSRRRVAADAHQRPTRRFQSCLSHFAASGRCRAAARLRQSASLPIWSCSVWGLPCLRHYCRSGALLPHLFTLTARSLVPESGPGAPRLSTKPERRYVLCGTGRPRALTPASRTLSGTLPCGVRTFLSRSSCELRQRPPGPPAVFQFTANAESDFSGYP